MQNIDKQITRIYESVDLHYNIKLMQTLDIILVLFKYH